MKVLDEHDESALETPAATPPVQVILVVHRAGDWLEETLLSLAAQDYENLHARVLLHPHADDAENELGAVTRLVDARLPGSDVTVIEPVRGFGEACNTVLADDDPPAYYLFCHDDVALAPDTTRLLVEESIRSNAGILGPKLVDWDNPETLLQVGMGLDKLAYLAPPVEPGELDQEQHDAIVDVFAVPGGCQLVRADLFHALQGFDPAMSLTGEDVEYSWRVHAAGARVVVVPGAVVRHRERSTTEGDQRQVAKMVERHRVRTLLSSYGTGHRIRILPQALLASFVAVLGAFFTGRFGRARDLVGAWVWNIAHWPARRRKSLSKVRSLGDAEVRRFQVRGFAPVSAFLRGPEVSSTQVKEGTSGWTRRLRSAPARSTGVFWFVAVLLFLFGSRHLLTRFVPIVGDMAPFDLGVHSLFEMFFDSWRPSGVGREGFAPTAYGLLGVFGTLALGNLALVRTVLTVCMLPVGAVGMWRFLGPFNSPWIRLVGVGMYVATPTFYNGLHNGSWGALVLFGALPWLVRGLGGAGELAPFGSLGGDEGPMVRLPSWPREVLAIGVVLALVVAVIPFAFFMFAAVVVALLVGSWLGASSAGAARLLPICGGALVVAFALHMPWLLDAVLQGPSWSWFAGSRGDGTGAYGIAELLRMDTGPFGGGVFGWALLVPAVLPLILGSGERWSWAVRGWGLYLMGVSLAFVGEQSWGPSLPRPEILLTPAALGIALAAAMGVAAFERDLRTYMFGWRQLIPVTALAAMALSLLPLLGASVGGWWNMPTNQVDRSMAFLSNEQLGNGRTLWLGHDDVLLTSGTLYRQDGSTALTAAISMDTVASIVNRYGGLPDDNVDLVHDVLDLGLDGRTSRMGAMLASFGIEYIVINERLAAAPSASLTYPVSQDIRSALAQQLDLAEIEFRPGITLYQNTAFVPVAATVPTTALAASNVAGFDGAVGFEPNPLVASDRPANAYTGLIRNGEELFVATPVDSRWRATVEGAPTTRSRAAGWANTFVAGESGQVSLHHSTPAMTRLAMALQLALWALVLLAIARMTVRAR